MAWNGRLPASISERFWPKVRTGRPDECWPWLASINNKGYGTFHVRIQLHEWKPRYAHRASWELAYGPIPDGLDVLHKCDNPPCVNPRHLFLGTHLDNMRDAVSKGRFPQGSKSYAAKLTEEQVMEIRALYSDNGKLKTPGSLRDIAKKFGISIQGACTAAHGRWTHVGPAVKVKRRQSWQSVSGRPSRGRHGATNPNAKLTAAKVDEMRRQYSTGVTSTDLAIAFGVARRTVNGILANKSWRDDL